MNEEMKPEIVHNIPILRDSSGNEIKKGDYLTTSPQAAKRKLIQCVEIKNTVSSFRWLTNTFCTEKEGNIFALSNENLLLSKWELYRGEEHGRENGEYKKSTLP